VIENGRVAFRSDEVREERESTDFRTIYPYLLVLEDGRNNGLID
jgi:hypothetical protein